MADYRIEVEVSNDRAPGMQPLVDLIADFLERECSCRQDEYTVIVHGPPEMRLVARPR